MYRSSVAERGVCLTATSRRKLDRLRFRVGNNDSVDARQAMMN